MQRRANRADLPHLLAALSALILLLIADAAAAQSAPLRITGRDTRASDSFGRSISAYAGTLVVGAPANSPAGAIPAPGAAYVFVRTSARSWVQQAKLVPGGSAQAGRVVAVSGNTAVLTTGNPGPAAHVYVRNGTSWTHQARIALAGSPQLKVALDGHRLILVSENTGIAYAYRRSSSGTWSRQQVINPDTGHPGFTAVAMSDGRAVLGAHDGSTATSAYVFQRSTAGTAPDRWTKVARVMPTTAESFTLFGFAVDTAQNRVVVGAIAEEDFAGAAYLFTRGANGVWTQTHRLESPSGTGAGTFGDSVAIHFDRMMIGEVRRSDQPERDSVAAHLYARNADDTWSRVTTVSARLDPFSSAVALSNCGAFAGSPGEGAVYVLPTASC